jgi:hypothetical protein
MRSSEAAMGPMPSSDAVLAPGDKLIQMVKLEGCMRGADSRERFLCIVERNKDNEDDNEEEYCLLGLDRIIRDDEDQEEESVVLVGLVLHLLWNVHVTLDGDGGFSLESP